EARLAAALSHPGVTSVFDAGLDDDRPYVVMELVEGETLQSRMAGGPLPVAEVARIGAQVATALAAVHAAGIVHRDVKPPNVIIGPDGAAKLTDLGVASPLAGDAKRGGATEPLFGTLPFVAPEVLHGEP